MRTSTASHRRSPRALIGAVVGASLVLALAACGGSTDSAVQAGPPGSAPPGTRTTAGTGTTLPTTDGTATAGTAPGADTTVAPAADGSTTTTAAGGPAVPGAPTTAVPGGPVTTLAPGVTRAPGGGGVNPPPPTPAPTVAPTTAPPTTAAPKPTISTVSTVTEVHCMGTATSTQASVKWTTTGATQVALANGDVPDAFAANPILNPNLNVVPSGQYPVTLSCSQTGQMTTVSARGPGGSERQLIVWTIHHM